ncbi:MAG: hypothetical protein QOG21_1359 [Actinomycetota bacterium]|nr:hypothetical protein [Actinomycetota bacterium]
MLLEPSQRRRSTWNAGRRGSHEKVGKGAHHCCLHPETRRAEYVKVSMVNPHHSVEYPTVGNNDEKQLRLYVIGFLILFILFAIWLANH